MASDPVVHGYSVLRRKPDQEFTKYELTEVSAKWILIVGRRGHVAQILRV
jgi:hypothetical protein